MDKQVEKHTQAQSNGLTETHPVRVIVSYTPFDKPATYSIPEGYSLEDIANHYFKDSENLAIFIDGVEYPKICGLHNLQKINCYTWLINLPKLFP